MLPGWEKGARIWGASFFLTAGQDWTDLEVYQFSLTSLAKGRTGSAYLAIKPKALDIQTPTNTRHKMKLAAVYKYSFLRHSNSHSNANKTQRRALKNLMKNQTFVDWNNVRSITDKEHQFPKTASTSTSLHRLHLQTRRKSAVMKPDKRPQLENTKRNIKQNTNRKFIVR